jgi:hypothetical protein
MSKQIAPELESSTQVKPVKEKKETVPTVPLKSLMRYFTTSDSVIFFFGGLAAFIAGAAMPSMALLFGDLTDTFNPESGLSDPLGEIGRISLIFLLLGVGVWLFSYIYFAFYLTIAAKA